MVFTWSPHCFHIFYPFLYQFSLIDQFRLLLLYSSPILRISMSLNCQFNKYMYLCPCSVVLLVCWWKCWIGTTLTCLCWPGCSLRSSASSRVTRTRCWSWIWSAKVAVLCLAITMRCSEWSSSFTSMLPLTSRWYISQHLYKSTIVTASFYGLHFYIV